MTRSAASEGGGGARNVGCSQNQTAQFSEDVSSLQGSRTHQFTPGQWSDNHSKFYQNLTFYCQTIKILLVAL